MEWKLGNSKDIGQSVWSGSLCDGSGRIQSEVECDPSGCHLECVQLSGEQLLDCQ